MDPRREAAIADLAEGIADYYFPDQWIDPEAIIRQLSLTLSFNNYGNAFDGLLEWDGDAFHIYCNLDRVLNCTSHRARFTLGHELGHYFIDDHRNAMRSGLIPSRHRSFAGEVNPTLVVEQEAQHFSSHLLMPQDRINRIVDPDALSRSVADIELIQRSFDVSFQSAAMRMITTARYAFCAGIMWPTQGSPWYRVSRGFIGSGFQHVRLNYAALPRDGATKICAQGEWSGRRLEPVIRDTLASAWFYHIQQGSRHDIRLTECALRLGSYGVFTFLSSL
jgi:uncharacterized protein DUF955